MNAYALFVARAVREAERKLSVPTGWYGSWRLVIGGGGRVRVRFGSRRGIKCWLVETAIAGGRSWAFQSAHDSRSCAIAKARKL